MNKEYDYKFSIITAVYNTEKYLVECIESVVNQKNIDFANEVQLILINDGSADSCDKICCEYKLKYPNIIYINKQNEGVSATRNLGIKIATGKYVNFLDSDDKLFEDSLSSVFEFFECNYNETDIVSIPTYFFDAKEGEHHFNFKFNSNRIIDLYEEFYIIQNFTNSAFIKNEIAKKVEFDKNLKFYEDLKYCCEVLLYRGKLGVCNGGKYLYRKRKEEDSAMDNIRGNLSYFTNTLENLHLDLIKKSIEMKGYLPKFIQSALLHEIRMRIQTDATMLDEFEDYKSKLINIIKQIDYKVILTQKVIDDLQRYIILNIKADYNLRLTENICNEVLTLYINNESLIDSKKIFLVIEELVIENNKLKIQCKVNNYWAFKGINEFNLYISVNKMEKKLDIIDNIDNSLKIIGETIFYNMYFTTEMEINSSAPKVMIYGRYRGEKVKISNINYNNNINKGYFTLFDN